MKVAVEDDGDDDAASYDNDNNMCVFVPQ